MPEIHSSWKINDHQAGISRCNFTFLDHVLQILKTPLATLNSIIENSILFPYFYWILVAYWENLRFYGRHKKLSIAVAQKLSCKKCTLVKVWRVPGQKTTFFGNICNCFKIQLTKNTAARLQNAVDMRPGQLYQEPGYEYCACAVSIIWWLSWPVFSMMERGPMYWEVILTALTFVWPPPLTWADTVPSSGWVLCYNVTTTICSILTGLNWAVLYSWLVKRRVWSNNYISMHWEQMHWPLLLKDDLTDKDLVLQSLSHPTDPWISQQKHGAKSHRAPSSDLTMPFRVKCWCKMFETYLTLSSAFTPS